MSKRRKVNKLQQLWRQITHVEEFAENSPREVRVLQICNQFALIIAFVIEIYTPVYWFLGFPEIGLLTFVIGLTILITIPLNKSRTYPLLGRQLLIFVCNAVIFIFCLILGRDCWVHLYFLNMMTLPFIVFMPKNNWQLKMWGIVPVALFYTLEVWGFNFFASSVYLTPEQQQKFYFFISPSVFVMTLVNSAFLYYMVNRNEKELLQKIEDLERSNRLIEEQQIHLAAATHFSAIADLSAGVAHEINNPLAIIKGYAEQTDILLKRKVFDLQQVNFIVQRIKETVDRITKITTSLRNLSREKSGDPFDNIDLHQTIADVVNISRVGLIQSGIDLRVDLGLEQAVYRARHVMISQVLFNLVHNAKDAVSDLDEKWIHIRLHDYQDRYEIVVVDSGLGISPDLLPHIFQPFYSTKSAGKGAGLGLSISNKIIADHSGHLLVDISAPHTTFVIRLPKCILR